MTVLVDGVSVGVLNPGSSVGWTAASAPSTYVPTSSTVVLMVRMVCTGTVPAGSNKDMYIDDIALTPV